MPRFIDWLGRMLDKEYYVGGKKLHKEFQRKYTFAASSAIALVALGLAIVEICQAPGKRELMDLLHMVTLAGGFMCGGAAVRWGWGEGRRVPLVAYAFVACGLLSAFAWWLLMAVGWSSVYSHEPTWQKQFTLIQMVSFPAGILHYGVLLWRWRRAGRSDQERLIIAASTGDVKGLDLCLNAGSVNVNGAGRDGLTPLMEACAAGQEHAAEVLLRHGAAPDASDALGLTSLHHAVLAGSRRAVELLLRNGAAVDAATLAGRTALHGAADAGRKSIARVLIDAGADVNGRTIEGVTPLECAAFNGHPKVAEVLLAAGADRTLRDTKGRDAADAAIEGGHLEIAERLRNKSWPKRHVEG